MRLTHTYLLRHVQNDIDSPPKVDVSSCVFSFVNLHSPHGVSPCEGASVFFFGVGHVNPNQDVHHMSIYPPPSWS